MRQEEGNAIVEFIGWSAVLVVPVLYLVVTLAQLQAMTFAVASAADAASRVLEVDDSPSAMDNAQVAMQLSLSDQGVDADPSGSLSVTCAHGCARGRRRWSRSPSVWTFRASPRWGSAGMSSS